MTKRFCDECGVEITAAQWWTRPDKEHLCRECNKRLSLSVKAAAPPAGEEQE